MYIPIWILIVAIIAIFYFIIKRFRKIESHLNISKGEVGAKIPTYDEMLKMNEDDFKKWITIRSEKPNRIVLLQEMIDQETRTHSFANTARKEITPASQAVLDMFNKDKSTDIADFLERLSNVASEEGDGDTDLVQDAIFAKAASDHVGLGAKWATTK